MLGVECSSIKGDDENNRLEMRLKRGYISILLYIPLPLYFPPYSVHPIIC
jgi:hypothetical protein